jgi:hypothetical protein
VIDIICRVSLHQKPALTARAVIPPLHLLSLAVLPQVDVVCPFCKAGLRIGTLKILALEGELVDGTFTAVGTGELKAQAYRTPLAFA